MYSELGGTEYQRVKFGFEGQQAEADAAALKEAMGHVFSNDQTLIRETLRNKTDDQRQAIAAAYKKLYGQELLVDFAWELRGDDHAVAYALWEGNTEKADAIEIKVAREGFWGPDHEKIEKVYTRVRDEATQKVESQGGRPRQINAEIARRTGLMANEYQNYTKRALLSDLESSFTPDTTGIWDPIQRENVKQYWAGRRDLVMGMATERPGARRRGQDPDRAHRVLRQGRDHQQGARAPVLAGLRQRPPGRAGGLRGQEPWPRPQQGGAEGARAGTPRPPPRRRARPRWAGSAATSRRTTPAASSPSATPSRD